MSKFLFVVHRYFPFPGGSEIYVHNMAMEAAARGHAVAVFTAEHKGDQCGIRVTSDTNILLEKWDLIVVHGSTPLQDFVLQNAKNIPSPILYMIILPSNNPVCIQALHDCAYVSWSTASDVYYLEQNNVIQKAKQVRHGIDASSSTGKPGFKNKYNIPNDKKMFLSVGGYWPNKKHKELADLFLKANVADSVLVTTGYDNRHNLMPSPVENKIIPLMIDLKQDVIDAIYEADCYLMHSAEEGFGLVILESMLNKTPWISRNIAGPSLINGYVRRGYTYDQDTELIDYLQTFDQLTFNLDAGRDYVLNNHLISNTIDDIEAVIKQV